MEISTFLVSLIVAASAMSRGESETFVARRFALFMPLGWVTGQLLLRRLGTRRVVREVGAILAGPFVFMFLFNLAAAPYYAVTRLDLLSLQGFLSGWLFLWGVWVVVGTVYMFPTWVVLRLAAYGLRRYLGWGEASHVEAASSREE